MGPGVGTRPHQGPAGGGQAEEGRSLLCIEVAAVDEGAGSLLQRLLRRLLAHLAGPLLAPPAYGILQTMIYCQSFFNLQTMIYSRLFLTCR